MKVPTVNIDVAQIDLVEEARFWAMVDIETQVQDWFSAAKRRNVA